MITQPIIVDIQATNNNPKMMKKTKKKTMTDNFNQASNHPTSRSIDSRCIRRRCLVCIEYLSGWNQSEEEYLQ